VYCLCACLRRADFQVFRKIYLGQINSKLLDNRSLVFNTAEYEETSKCRLCKTSKTSKTKQNHWRILRKVRALEFQYGSKITPVTGLENDIVHFWMAIRVNRMMHIHTIGHSHCKVNCQWKFWIQPTRWQSIVLLHTGSAVVFSRTHLA